jgi:hypothetical protein
LENISEMMSGVKIKQKCEEKTEKRQQVSYCCCATLLAVSVDRGLSMATYIALYRELSTCDVKRPNGDGDKWQMRSKLYSTPESEAGKRSHKTTSTSRQSTD